MSQPAPFKRRQCETEIIVLCVRWYVRYALSYRNLEVLLERGISVDHTTSSGGSNTHAMRNESAVARSTPFSLSSTLPGRGFRALTATPQPSRAPHPLF